MSSVLGEPLGARHGILKWINQPTWGTPVTPITAVGAATWNPTIRPNQRRRRAPGSPNPLAHKPGNLQVPFDIGIESVQYAGLAFLLQAKRSGGELPKSTLLFGYELDGGTRSGQQVSDCVIHSLELDWRAGEDYSPLGARVTGVGGVPTVIVPAASQVHLPGEDVMVWEATTTLDTVSFEMESFRMRVEHNVRVQHVSHGTAPASVAVARAPRRQSARSEVITGEVVILGPSGYDFSGATSALKDLECSFVQGRAGVGSARVKVLATDLTWDEENFGAQDMEGEMRWTLPFEATTWDLVQDTA